MYRRFLILTLALAACKDRKAPTLATRPSMLPDSAEQMAFGLTHELTTKGIRRAQLRADTAFFYDDGKRIEMRRMSTVFYTPDGVKNGTMVSDQGTYDRRTDKVDGRGNVRVVSEDGRRLTSPHLVYERLTNQISSDTSFEFVAPGRQLRGVGLRADPQLHNVLVLGSAGGRAVVPAGAAAPARRP